MKSNFQRNEGWGKEIPPSEELGELPHEKLMLEVLTGTIVLLPWEVTEPAIDQITIDGEKSCVIIVAEI